MVMENSKKFIEEENRSLSSKLKEEDKLSKTSSSK